VGVQLQGRQGRAAVPARLAYHRHRPNDRQSIPYGTLVSSVVSQAREIVKNAKGGVAGISRVDVPDAVFKKIVELEAAGRIKSVGPTGMEYKQREAGGDGEHEAHLAQNAFFKDHLGWGAQMPNKRQSTNRMPVGQPPYALFNDEGMAALDRNSE
jgi:hypothetical protein